MLLLSLFTADPALAAAADAAGVGRIGVDLELLGKEERQAGHGLRLSRHRVEDLPPVVAALTRAQAFARINALHVGSPAEIEAVLAAGAQAIMLPYFHTVETVARFITLVGGRAQTIALVETVAALEAVPALSRLPGLDEAYLGLNDLRLEMALPSPEAVLAAPVFTAACKVLTASGMPFGIGSVGRDTAPFRALGATRALLSRSVPDNPEALTVAVAALRTAWQRS